MTREHVWNISQNLLSREDGAPECKMVLRYISTDLLNGISNFPLSVLQCIPSRLQQLRHFRGMFKMKTRRYYNSINRNFGYFIFGTFFHYETEYIQWMQVLHHIHSRTPNSV